MAAHQVDMTLPTRELGRADATFEVRADGKMLGSLHVSRGAVVWFPSGATYGYKLEWAEFADVMQVHGNRSEAR